MTSNADKAAEELRRINAQRKLVPFDVLQALAKDLQVFGSVAFEPTAFDVPGFRVKRRQKLGFDYGNAQEAK